MTDCSRNPIDKRKKIDDDAEKRESNPDGPSWGIKYSNEEIEAEERRPKRKVAVFVGYSGTGYKGMQIMPGEPTIEGDLFEAFIKAGAISKANADDPKKASLVRCARTDKGVHAAGNMISLKLIIEDEDIVEKINTHLSPQIRVWGIERTVQSFSCYQQCDSRWYEYFIPSYAFLPPWPKSFLGQQLVKLAEEAGDLEQYESRQEEVRDYWADIEQKHIKPVLDEIDEDIRADVTKALQGEEEARADANPVALEDAEAPQTLPENAAESAVDDEANKEDAAELIIDNADEQTDQSAVMSGALPLADLRVQRLRKAAKQLRQAILKAKRAHRVDAARIKRIQAALDKYVGTVNFHNYTVHKSFKDPSVKRHIKSFVVNPEPILIGEGNDEDKTEWLSMKVHGQSFMMHQIRKMVGMVALMVRCGSNLATMEHSFTNARYSIPKVPGLGLMLERPVFDAYNSMVTEKHGREKLLFNKYEKQIEEFKRREIYAKMFAEEEERGEFSKFFNHIDNFHEPTFLWVTSKGLAATAGAGRKEGYAEANGKHGQ